jgi:rubredoxin
MSFISIVDGDAYWEEVERRKLAIVASVESGEVDSIDGVMSPSSRAIAERLGTTNFDMNSWWLETPQTWTCPACGRNKLDIARVNTKGEAMCWLVEHHDHMQDVLKKRFQELSVQREAVVADHHSEEFAKRSASMISAYENALICMDCNNADAEAKKAVRAPAAFSFSPNELRRIVIPNANKMVGVNQEMAKSIWVELKETFELRMKIANRIAEIAANNEHWFQAGEWAKRPSVVHSRASDFVSSRGAFGVFDLLRGPKKKIARPLDAWRKVTHKPPSPGPTPTEIDHAGQVGSPKQWHAIPTSWQCPGCGRDKRSIVRKNKLGEWAFITSVRYFYDEDARWKNARHLTCIDCAKVAEDIGKEAAGRIGKRISSYSARVQLEEVTKCIIVHPHTRHNTKNSVVDTVVELVEARILDQISSELDKLEDGDSDE